MLSNKNIVTVLWLLVTVSYVQGMTLSTLNALFQLFFNNCVSITPSSEMRIQTQRINWPKSKQESSRINMDHPKALTTWLFYCTFFSGSSAKKKNLSGFFNVTKVTHQASAQAFPPLWETSIPLTHSPGWVKWSFTFQGTLCFLTLAALTTVNPYTITITWGAFKSPDAQAIPQNN